MLGTAAAVVWRKRVQMRACGQGAGSITGWGCVRGVWQCMQHRCRPGSSCGADCEAATTAAKNTPAAWCVADATETLDKGSMLAYDE